MKPFRGPHVTAWAMLAALAAGCAADDDIAARPNTTRPTVVGAAVELDPVRLDGVRFDVRRDPG